jgi:hypothetical protein
MNKQEEIGSEDDSVQGRVACKRHGGAAMLRPRCLVVRKQVPRADVLTGSRSMESIILPVAGMCGQESSRDAVTPKFSRA